MSMQDRENNTWIILDPSGNIYEMHDYLTVMNPIENNTS